MLKKSNADFVIMIRVISSVLTFLFLFKMFGNLVSQEFYHCLIESLEDFFFFALHFHKDFLLKIQLFCITSENFMSASSL